MTDVNLNLDQKTLEACLKQINNIGSTTYSNICTNQLTIIPWGIGDWILNLGAFFFLALFIILLFIMVVLFITALKGAK